MVPFSAALPIIMGQNIGTCITAILSAIGASKNAKRAAMVHLYFNLIGTMLFMAVFYAINAAVHFSFMARAATPAGIAILHSAFNITATLVLLPFGKALEKLACLTIRDRKEEEEKVAADPDFMILESRFLEKPAFAVEQSRNAAKKMAEDSHRTLFTALDLLNKMFVTPSFTAVREIFNINVEVLGGYFCSNRIQAAEQARLAAKILSGTPISSVPIVESPKEYLYDWVEMQRLGISKEEVPTNVHVINMPISERYKIEVFIASSLGVILLLALIGYLFYLYWREARRRKEVLANLKQEKEHLSLALEGGNIFAWKLQSGTFRFDNEFFSSVNISPREIPLDELYEMTHPDDRQSLRSLIDFICTGTISHHILQYRCDFNGKGYQWWEFRYGSLEDANDGYVINGLCLNIQNIKDTEEVLISAREKAEESDRMKSAFLANMSHEIRTPLNAIVGFSNLMNSEEVLEPEEREQFVKLINTNSDLLLKLINDILDLSRMESGKMSFVFDRHDLNVLINEIYCTFQLMMPEGVELRMRVPEIPVVVAVDPYRLKQVLSNFINNAIKFTTSGYIEVGYYFCTKGDCLHIYVEDTGIGIPEEKQKQVFDRFCKLDEFAQGTGLGLAICQVIAQRFGGEIQLKSEYGKGSRFTLTLPKERIG